MRTFSCFTHDSRHQTPTLAFVFAADDAKARELARRELLDTPGGVEVEIVEDGRTLAVLRLNA
ncbi:hypothetical protein [Phenylobacterium sp.]|uniref:hypothetical protein n=1 Tax=Phenylobacterium sp. TaxID=1871053 RepID=UPI002CB017E5|nr:hypothetical protein [Phenylobacterium sp.]HVI31227.1 hypothetical protein [Phenylobacterium sp.]